MFGEKEKGQWTWAFFWGMAPDLFSFGPFFLTHLGMIARRWTAGPRMEPPDPAMIPSYVYHSYNVTHSLVVWALIIGVAWAVRRKYPWVLNAGPLHILCDIPTHSTKFFPTPYLWPLPTPLIDGRPWSHPPFMMINYALIALTYFGVYLYKRRRISA